MIAEINYGHNDNKLWNLHIFEKMLWIIYKNIYFLRLVLNYLYWYFVWFLNLRYVSFDMNRLEYNNKM
jgi:hypothetical protein